MTEGHIVPPASIFRKPYERVPDYMIRGPAAPASNVFSPAINKIVVPRRELLVQDFSNRITSALKSETRGNSLDAATAAVNDSRDRNLPFVPKVIQTNFGTGDVEFASATRNQIKWGGVFSRDQHGELQYEISEGKKPINVICKWKSIMVNLVYLSKTVLIL